MSQIVTGEAVALDLRVARIGSRSVALFIDLFLKGIAIFAVVLLFGSISVLDQAAGQAVSLVLLVGILLGYPVAFETLWRGKTPGKAVMGLRVVRDDGGPVRFRHALIRGLIGTVLELPGFFLFIPAVVTSLASERGKRVGDFAAGTVVIQERVPSRAMAVVPMPQPLAQWAASLDLSRLSNELALGIRGFFERSGELSPQARDQLGHSLTVAVVSVISPAPPPGTPPWAILAAVLAERRRRDEYRLHQQRQTAMGGGLQSWQGQQPGWGPPGSAQQPGWGSPGSTQPPGAASATPWQASAPPTGTPSSYGPPPRLPQSSYFPAAPEVPPAPAPVPAAPPVPASDPPPADGFQPPS